MTSDSGAPAPRSPAAQDFQAAAEALARISHELKTPLVTVKGYAELLLDQTQQPLTPALREWVKRIAAAANRLDALFRKVTGEARAEADWSYHPRGIGAEEWLRRSVEEAEALAGGRALRWSWETAPGTPPVLLDPEAGRDVLLELLQNAARATPDGGEIRLYASTEERGGRRGVRVTVTDTGVGVPEGTASEPLFERFMVLGDLEGHHSGDFEYQSGGLGLGLSMVRGVVRAHGGEVWAEGRGRDPARLPGAAFHVWLPAADGASPADAGTSLSPRKERLLVADSDPDVRQILAEALSETYGVEAAASGADALEKWRSAGEPWAGCIFDPNLPDLSGVDFASSLRGHAGAEHAALIAYATTESSGAAEALRTAGVDTCLWKPVRTRVLLQRLGAIRNRRSRP